MPANRKLNIAIWAFPSWKGDYLKSTVELAKELALRHNVLYIDYAYTIKDVMFPGKIAHLRVNPIMHSSQSLEKETLDNGGSLHILSLPPIIPFNWTAQKSTYRAIEAINNNIVAARVNGAMHKLGFKADIVVNAFNPFFGNASLKVFSKCPAIYYCYDNIGASHWAAKHGQWLENEFVQKVNAVIFSSDALLTNKGWKAPTHVVKNGVDLRNFGQANQPRVKGNEMVVGYVGSMDDRLDFQLLEMLAKNNPQLHFQFIGRIMTQQVEQINKYSNVSFTGAVVPSALPSMMQQFSAGIIPFVNNEFTRNIYPMKVNEYLALGLPVVATNFAKLDDLHGFIEIANNATDFNVQLLDLIATDNEQKRERRILKAKSNSWEQKALEFENILLRYAV